MVRRAWPACLLACATCADLEGTVLVLRDAASEPDAGAAMVGDAEAVFDAAPDAAHDAGNDTLGVCRVRGADDSFHDLFDGDALAPERWLVADGHTVFGGRAARGGFLRENVAVEAGALVLRVRGDLYAGPLRGIGADGSRLPDGRRSAAAIATRDQFASGTYQAVGVLVGPPGVEVALWMQRDDDSAGAFDIATPGLAAGEPSYAHVSMRTRAGLSDALENQFALPAPFAAGESHILRFDWYTSPVPAVVFWVDDESRWEAQTQLPGAEAGRMWIVAWVPDDSPAAFEAAEIRIDNAFVRPFGNDADRCVDGTLIGPGLSPP